jgi:hypothetical protein
MPDATRFPFLSIVFFPYASSIISEHAIARARKMSEQVSDGFSASNNEQRHGESRYSNQRADGRSAASIAIGGRFRMSALGAARSPRLAKKEGTIVGCSRLNSSIRVLFDGSKSPISLHRDYVEQLTSDLE